jgi:hypothetical protein
MIDSASFLLYGHWIKKDEHQNQNRATLFQTEEKSDLVRHEQLLEHRRLDRQESKLLRLQNQNEVDDGLTLPQQVNGN